MFYLKDRTHGILNAVRKFLPGDIGIDALLVVVFICTLGLRARRV